MTQGRKREMMDGMLYTDLYQLTMAQLYFRLGMHEKHAQFDHFFRKYPAYDGHQAGYCVNAGMEWLLEWMQSARFTDDDIACLRARQGRDGQRLFGDEFLAWLQKEGTFDGLTVRAIPEGRVVHSNVPVTVVEGPLAMAQILETPLLNFLNYPTLVATKAARVKHSARDGMVIDFGMRRAQERAANAGTRAALIGGADFTSNTGLSCAMGLPPKGTHAHSMVQAFLAMGKNELDAFRAYAEVYPENCLLLVDTISTLDSGVPNAIRVFEELRKAGHEPMGIRLDSGDLAYLAVQSAKMLNEAGFEDVSIVLSNQLDEVVIGQILSQVAEEVVKYGVDADHTVGRLVYGVGTRMITSEGSAALDGVYKLVSLKQDEEWQPAIKLSETPSKTLNPGYKHVWRVYDDRGLATADVLTLRDSFPDDEKVVLRHPTDHTKKRILRKAEISSVEPLLEEVLRAGQRVCEVPSLETLRNRRKADCEKLDVGVQRLVNPHIYHVSLSQGLWALKEELIQEMSSGQPGEQ